MNQRLIMEHKPEKVKRTPVCFTIQDKGKARGTLEVSGTKVKWLEKGKIVRGFEMKWAEFANFMVKNGKAV